MQDLQNNFLQPDVATILVASYLPSSKEDVDGGNNSNDIVLKMFDFFNINRTIIKKKTTQQNVSSARNDFNIVSLSIYIINTYLNIKNERQRFFS